MPTGYAGEGKVYSKKLGRWVNKENEKAFDYEGLDLESAGFMVSFFRYYPDYYADLCRSPNAQYKLELPQRIMLRINARYRKVYTTGVRGLTKTYIVLLGKMIQGELYPGIKIRYCAPNQKQAATLATQAFHQIERDYPLIASYWQIRNDRDDMFRITTIYGSEFTMYAPRGDNCHGTIAEEIGQEGKDPFDMEKYERDILPTCRLERTINLHADPYFVQLQQLHISNACSRQNRAFSVHRADCLKEMLHGEPFDGYVIDFSWISAVMGNLRSVSYIKDQRGKLSEPAWKREMCALYTGDSENPLIPDERLMASRVGMIAELEHSGDPDAIYIVSHDVAYVDDPKNAKCGDVVLKLTRYEDEDRELKYRKQVVFTDSYAPPATDVLHARKVKDLWRRFCMNGGGATYLVVDAQAYGSSIVEELMKPTTDGTRPLCCINHAAFQSIEQPNALPVIYPMKATGRGADADGDMIAYAQIEFEQGNVELLTPNILDGVEAYKALHRIKDARYDAIISVPYRMTELLCQQISNLMTEVSGVSVKEKRKSKAIQRDSWSALKYALRMAQKIESGDRKDKYGAKSTWSEKIRNAPRLTGWIGQTPTGARANVIAMRRVIR